MKALITSIYFGALTLFGSISASAAPLPDNANLAFDRDVAPMLALPGSDTSGFTETTDNAGTVTSAVAVPEVSSWVMMLAGFGFIGLVGYRRHKKPSIGIDA